MPKRTTIQNKMFTNVVSTYCLRHAQRHPITSKSLSS